jgi:hypothetical protein
MRTEPSELIERYLHSRGRRYFRGHHDGEYFFILTVGHERLHVHLEILPGSGDVLAVRVAPGHFFPAADRERMISFARSWNAESRRAEVIVHESSDPNRIGVAAESSCAIADGIDAQDFADFADKTIRSAIKLFAELTPRAQLKNAG